MTRNVKLTIWTGIPYNLNSSSVDSVICEINKGTTLCIRLTCCNNKNYDNQQEIKQQTSFFLDVDPLLPSGTKPPLVLVSAMIPIIQLINISIM